MEEWIYFLAFQGAHKKLSLEARTSIVSCSRVEDSGCEGRVSKQQANPTRRSFLSGIAATAGALSVGCSAGAKSVKEGRAAEPGGPPDVTLRIAPVVVEIAKNHAISTIGYNNSVPGPLIRLREGVPATIEIFNDTDTPELVHWHGMVVPSKVDGAEEEGSLVTPAHGHLRYRLTPQPSGTRFVHTHVMSMTDLCRGTFTGQFGFVYIDPKRNPGRYDQEIFLATHEWEPYFTMQEEEEYERHEGKEEEPHGWEVRYQRFTINGKCLGSGEPVRVKQGQRVLFHLLNASATENIRLALAGHRFQVVALDGNPVPNPELIDVLELGTAERIDAVVTMDNPGVWIFGSPKEDERKNGMGIVIEYANRSGAPQWISPPKRAWDYTLFGDNRRAPKPDEVIPLVFGLKNGKGRHTFEQWTINGASYDPRTRPRALDRGRRYRLSFDNQSEDMHPVHLHRDSFELIKVNGKPTTGVIKDVVLVKAFQKVEADVTPSMQGLSLFHCHHQVHMDQGFKMLFEVR